MKVTLSDYGQELQTPTAGQVYDVTNQYKPSTYDVAGAFVEDAFKGVGSAAYIKTFAEKTIADKGGQPISKEEFEKSEYNIPSVNYYDGMTREGLEVLYDHQKEQEGRNFIMSRASGGQLAAGFGAGLVSGIFEPANIALSAATAGAGSALGLFKSATLAGSAVKKALVVGVAESTAQTAIAAPLNVAMSKKMQDNYTAMDIFLDWSIGTALGTGINVGAVKIRESKAKKALSIKNKMYGKISDASNKYGLDSDVMYLISGYESSSVTKPNMKAYNKKTGAFGPFQFLPDTAEDYGITRNSTYDDQLDAYMRFTKDNIAYVEKRIGRPLDDHEVYLSHWMGRGGAAAVLKASPTDKAVDVFKKNGIYRGYEPKVLSQNRFPKDATIGELIRGTRDRLNHHRKNIDPNHQTASIKKAEEADLSVMQVMHDKLVNLDPLYARRATVSIDKGIKSISNMDIKKSKSVASGLPMPLYDMKAFQKIETSIDEADFPAVDIPTPERAADILAAASISYDKGSLDGALNILSGFSKVDNLARKYAARNAEYRTRVLDLKESAAAYNQAAKNEGVTFKKEKIQSLFDEVEVKKDALSEWLALQKTTVSNDYNAAVAYQNNPLNNPLYDNDAINYIDKIAQDNNKESFSLDKQIEEYSAIIEDYKKRGMLTEEMSDALVEMDNMDAAAYNDIYSDAAACLLTLGRK